MTDRMTARTPVHSLHVATPLHAFINDEVLPGTGVSIDAFWTGFDAIVRDLAPRNAALLAERERLQSELVQKVSMLTPVPGNTWSLMKACSGVATCRLWTVVRSVMVGAVGGVF